VAEIMRQQMIEVSRLRSQIEIVQAQRESKIAQQEVENAFSNANHTTKSSEAIFPELATRLQEIVKVLAPQLGVLGDRRLDAFPGVNGSNSNE
jgi:uncharacterized membrane protein YqiK